MPNKREKRRDWITLCNKRSFDETPLSAPTRWSGTSSPLGLKTGACGVSVVYESGSALLPLAAATNDVIVLQPWGAIDGTLYLTGQPAPNQRISVTGT